MNRNLKNNVTAAAVCCLVACSWILGELHGAENQAAKVDRLKFGGEMTEEQAKFSLTGRIKSAAAENMPPIYSSRTVSWGVAGLSQITQTIELEANLVRGKFDELEFDLMGSGDISKVEGDGLQHWSIRRSSSGQRRLVIRADESKAKAKSLTLQIHTLEKFDRLPGHVRPLLLAPVNPALHEGLIRIQPSADVALKVVESSGLTPLEPKHTPSLFPQAAAAAGSESLIFRYYAKQPSLVVELTPADPDASRMQFDRFELSGSLAGDRASFVLKGVARAKHPRGGELLLLSDGAALTGMSAARGARIEYREARYYLVKARDTLSGIAAAHAIALEDIAAANEIRGDLIREGQRLMLPLPEGRGGYYLVLDEAGEIPVELRFDARVKEREGWRALDFAVAASSLRPISISGLSPATTFRQTTTSAPVRQGDQFLAHLTSAGRLALEWRETEAQAEGRLFYSVESLAEVRVSPGLMRQTHWFEIKVMQGEMNRVAFAVAGEGEIVRVSGPDLLSWAVEPQGKERMLLIQLNQAKKTDSVISVSTQAPLGVFPLAMSPLRFRPEGAVRSGGHVRVVNDGAVRLEVLSVSGISQISPKHFPSTQALPSLEEQPGAQVFTYRFSEGAYELRVRADNILPEVSVSELLVYHTGENESVIEAELELQIREAPLREFQMLIPARYVIAQLNNAHLADYFVTPEVEGNRSRLRVVFSGPILGREVIQLRLEQSRELQTAPWILPRIEPLQAKSVRGYLGISSDPGLRLTSVRASDSVTEIGPAFFPNKREGLQLAWRLRDGNWEVTAGVERLELSVQVEALHLYSIGEGIAFGSSILNYWISGAPVSRLRFVGPTNVNHLEFAGREVRGWRLAEDGNYEVTLHAPVYGAYTLLGTYERPFTPQGARVSFEGLQPLGVQAERGHVIVISDHQFQVSPSVASGGLIAVEPAELPAEHRLLFASPILGSYQYVARPFDLALNLKALPQGTTMDLIVDRASIESRVSSESHAITDLRYFLKSRGRPHLRLTLPPESEIWSSMVDGNKAVPVADGKETLIPLPQRTDSSAIVEVTLRVAVKSPGTGKIGLGLPIVAAPVLQLDWRVMPEANHRLTFQGGSLRPVGSSGEFTGFRWIQDVFGGAGLLGREGGKLLLTAAWLLAGLLAVRWATEPGRRRGDLKNVWGIALGTAAFGIALATWATLAAMGPMESIAVPQPLRFEAPVLDANSAVRIEIKNQELSGTLGKLSSLWPVLLAFGAWVYAGMLDPGAKRRLAIAAGWMLALWAGMRAPFGGVGVGSIVSLFLLIYILWPAWNVHRRLERATGDQGQGTQGTPSGRTSPGSTVALLFVGLFLSPQAVQAAAPGESKNTEILSIEQSAELGRNELSVKARLRWKTRQGVWLDFLRHPAVLTRIEYPIEIARLVESQSNGRPVYRLTPVADGEIEVAFDYQIPLKTGESPATIELPTPFGLINRFIFEAPNQDIEVYSRQAASIHRELLLRNGKPVTRAELVLAPGGGSSVSWRPRSRDIQAEAIVFYAETSNLLIPGAGVIEGVHDVQGRVAQGQLQRIELEIPETITITDVEADFVSAWRFDPDGGGLRVEFKAPQSGTFALRILSQAAAQPLPYERSLGLPGVKGAAGHVGSLGVATGSGVQIEKVDTTNAAPMNLEDFPKPALARAAAKAGDTGLVLRRAFRFSGSQIQVTLSAAPVQPDVRVVAQETLSLAADRTVLAADLNVQISRAGIFKLSFALPKRLEVESLSGPSLSHWTESRNGEARIVTLHLKGQTEGRQKFALTLAGPGLTGQTQLVAPRVTLLEASKQTGQLVVTPELGVRLHAVEQEGVLQLDPKELRIQQPGVIAFRLLQNDWRLNLAIETVEPSVQVNIAQDVTVKEGQTQVAVNFDYQIENAAIDTLRIRLPSGAQSVVFNGQWITDSSRADPGTNRLASWTLKHSRRITGEYRLRLTYKLPGAGGQLSIAGIAAEGVSLQRGHVAIRSGGRIEVQLAQPGVPSSLANAHWQSVPASLKRGLVGEEPNYLFRVVDSEFELRLNVVRHELAKLLPARVERVDLRTTVSPGGEALTDAHVVLFPGDKRLLRLRLPAGSEFWFAFVNGESALPWNDGDRILIPIEKHSDPNLATDVEIIYASAVPPRAKKFDHHFRGPEFDLPLQNITWTIQVDDRWKVVRWDDRWQLQNHVMVDRDAASGIDQYLSAASERKKALTLEAESLLQRGTELVQRGDPQLARKAYRAALELSQHDSALNEDARVQLQALKQQQAVVGLNFLNRASAVTSPSDSSQPASAPFRLDETANFTPQQAKELMERTSTEDSTALMRLAERLVKQQEAAVNRPEAVRTTLPDRGRQAVFTRSLLVDGWSGLDIGVDFDRSASEGPAMLWPWIGLGLALGFIGWGGKRLLRARQPSTLAQA